MELNDDQRPGGQEVSNHAKCVEKFREIIGHDANFTTRMLAKRSNANKNTIWNILTEDLGKRRRVRVLFHMSQMQSKKVNEFWIKKRIPLINHLSY